MVGIVIAAHGKLGEGFNDAMSLIVGEQEQIKPLNLDPEMSPEELKERMTAALERLMRVMEFSFLSIYLEELPVM